uniref:Uncharacterized protein n=1 Tax=Arundo donax TaxID=35708 RepID=A0A0A9AJD1_ARUDO
MLIIRSACPRGEIPLRLVIACGIYTSFQLQ